MSGQAQGSTIQRQGHFEGHPQEVPIDRVNNDKQAGERYRSIDQWERDDLVLNLVGALSQCNSLLQEKLLVHTSRCDEEFGRRVAEGIACRHRPSWPLPATTSIAQIRVP